MTMEVILDDKMMKSETFWDFKGQVDYVDQWFMMRSPTSMLLILMGYWFFVFYLGPEYMKNKPAFKMSRPLALYNIVQIGLSSYLFYIGTKIMLTQGLTNSSCVIEEEAVIYSITNCCYIYHFAKITELLDTVFFILKKNYRQVTFLHIYHHSMTIVLTWFILKYEPTHNVIFLGTLNSFVHVVMYTYYYLSAFPELSKYLWWKKYITKMQIAQFILMLIRMAGSYYFSGCPISYILQTTVILNTILLIVLFAHFYINAYKK